MPFDINGGYVPDDSPSPAMDWLHWLTSGNTTPPQQGSPEAPDPGVTIPWWSPLPAIGRVHRASGPFSQPDQPPAAPAPAPAPAPQAPPAAPMPAPKPVAPAAPAPAPAAPQAPPAVPQAPSAPPPLQQDAYAQLNLPSQGSKEGNYYASAIPPPSVAMQGVLGAAVQKYAQQYNLDPAQLLKASVWTGYHESGWNPNALGPQTKSGRGQGIWQFMPGTAQQFNLTNPNDVATSTDAGVHYIAQLAAKHGGDLEQAIGDYGTFSTGQGAQADMAARNGFREFMGQGPIQGPTIATNSEVPSGAPPGMSGPPDLSNIKLPYPGDETQLPRGNKLLALAAGILSGRTMGEGLGKGLQNLNALSMADITNKRAANSQAIQLAQIGALNNYRAQMAKFAAGRLAVQQAGVPIRQEQASTSLQRMLNTTTPEGVAANATARTGANQTTKENVEDIDRLYNDAADAQTRAPQIEAMRQLLGSGQVATGPGLASFKRQLSNFFNVDLGSDPTQTQLTGAVASQLRGTSAFAKNMRNVKEFNSLMEGLTTTDLQNPQAMGRLVNGIDNLNQLKLQLGSDWRSLPPQQQAAMRGNQDTYQNWFQTEVSNWRQGLDKKGGFYGLGMAAPNASQPAAPGTVTGAYNGIQYQFKPGQ